MMAGSVPPGNDDLWAHAEDAGYQTDLLRKIEHDDGSLGEQAVDELMHLKIANVLLDFDEPQTLVLVTGDGKVSTADLNQLLKWNFEPLPRGAGKCRQTFDP